MAFDDAWWRNWHYRYPSLTAVQPLFLLAVFECPRQDSNRR